MQLCRSYSSPYCMERATVINSEFGYEMPSIKLKVDKKLFIELLKNIKISIIKNSTPRNLSIKQKSYTYVEGVYGEFRDEN